MPTRHKKPTISVFMPVYNAADFVVHAVKSIQNQTFTDWEMVIVDDLSTDGTYDIVQKLARKDSRIRIYRNGKHRGVSGAGNLAIPQLRGQYIARMDADDIALPYRFERQLAFLQRHPDTVAVGGQCTLINREGQTIGKKEFPTDPQHIREMMMYRIPVQQPSMMVNTKLLPKNFVWYEESYNTAEEVELLFKFFQYGKIRNLHQEVLKYRIHGRNVSLKNPKATFYLTFKTRLFAIKKYHYRPTFKGLFVTFAQCAAVTLLPNSWIYPLYSLLYLSKKTVKKITNFFNLSEFSFRLVQN